MTGKTTALAQQQATVYELGFHGTADLEDYRKYNISKLNYQGVPDAPTGVVGTLGNGQITVTFTPPDGQRRFTYHELYRHI